MLDPRQIDELASFALELADAAAAVTLPHFRSGSKSITRKASMPSTR